MTTGLQSRDRAVLLFGVATITALLLLARGIPTVSAWNATHVARATSLAYDIAAARAAPARLPAVRLALSTVRARAASIDVALVSASSAAAAVARLAALVEDRADSAGAKIVSTQLRWDSTGTRSTAHVALRVVVVADVNGLMALLRSIEGGPELLVVDELTVTQSDPAAPADRSEALRAELSVSTLARITAGSAQ
jgi:hypothetical protein